MIRGATTATRLEVRALGQSNEGYLNNQSSRTATWHVPGFNA